MRQSKFREVDSKTFLENSDKFSNIRLKIEGYQTLQMNCIEFEKAKINENEKRELY